MERKEEQKEVELKNLLEDDDLEEGLDDPVVTVEGGERDEERRGGQPAARAGGRVGRRAVVQDRVPDLREEDEGRVWIRVGGKTGLKPIYRAYLMILAVIVMFGNGSISWYLGQRVVCMVLYALSCLASYFAYRMLVEALNNPQSILICSAPPLFVIEYGLAKRNEYFALDDVLKMSLTADPANQMGISSVILNFELRDRPTVSRVRIGQVVAPATGANLGQIELLQQVIRVYNAGHPVVPENMERILAFSTI